MAEAVQHPPQHCPHRAGKHTRPVSGAARCLALALALALPLAFTGTANAATIYWDGNDTTGDADGGTGTWDTTATNWDDAATAGNPVSWDNATPDIAIFGGTAGTVTLGTAITADSLQFDTANYIVTGNTLTLSGSATVTANQNATIQSVIAGTAGLTKAGTGTLTVTGVNTYTGNTTISAGTLEIGSAGQLGSGSYAGAISNSGTLNYNSSANQTLSGVISGSGALQMNGSGTLTLTGANTYTGATTINAGRLQLGDGGTTGSLSTSSAIGIASGAAFMVNRTDTVTQGTDFSSSAITGAGFVVNAGDGTLVLGANSHTGGVRLGYDNNDTESATRVVRVTHSDALGTGTLGFYKSGTFELGADALTITNDVFSGNYSGEGNYKIIKLDLAGTNSGTMSGNIDTRGGIFEGFQMNVGADDTLELSGNIYNGAGGGSGITKTGLGTLILSGTNTYDGETRVKAGTLKLSGGSAIEDIRNVFVDSSGTLDLNDSDETINKLTGSGTVDNTAAGTATLIVGTTSGDATFDGTITDTGAALKFTKIGSGTQTLTAASSYSGGTDIYEGTIVASHSTALGTGQVYMGVTNGVTQTLAIGADGVNIANNFFLQNSDSTHEIKLDLTGTNSATLSGDMTNQVQYVGEWDFIVGADDTLTVSGILQNGGAGGSGIDKDGAGTLVFSGANTYQGDTRINAGTLKLSGGSALADGAGKGDVIVNASGTLDLNGSNETINGLSGTGVVNNTAVGAVTLTVGNNNDTTTFSGTIQDTGGNLSLLKVGTGTLTLDTANTHAGATGVREGTINFTNQEALGTGQIQMGYQATEQTLEFGASGMNVDNAFFIQNTNGANRTIRLDVTGTATGEISGNTDLRLTSPGIFIYDVGTDDTLTNSGVISNGAGGGAGITKTGAGTLVLTGVNTYAGGTTVSGGTLQIGGAGRLGNGLYAGAVTIDSGATFQYSSSASGTAARYSGNISGAGTFIKDGSNSELRFIGNTSVANIEIKQGTLRVQNNVNALGQGGTTVYLGDTSGSNDATLFYVANVSPFTTKAGIVVQAGSTGTKTILTGNSAGSDDTPITLNDDLTINTATQFTLGGAIGGSGGMTKIGNDTLVLSGVNTYSGDTTVNAGTVQLSGGSALADGTGKGDLIINASGTLDVNGTSETINGLSGSGIVDNTAVGTATLTVGNDNDTTTFSGTMQDTGGDLSLVKVGTGTLTLSGNNTYSGGTTVNGGELHLEGGTNTLLANSTLTIDGASSVVRLGPTNGAANIFGSGALFIQNGGTLTDDTPTAVVHSINNGLTFTNGGTLTSNVGSPATVWGNYYFGGGDVTVTGNAAATISAEEITLNSGGINFLVNDVTSNANTDLTISSVIRNYGASASKLLKAGAGTMELTGVNTYTGDTTISAGTLEIGSAGQLGSGSYAGAIANSGIFEYNSSAAQTLSGVISGAGELQKDNTGTLTLTGDNTYTGTTTVTNGILALNNATTSNTTIAGDANTATFDVTIVGGTLRIDANEQIANDASITMSSGTFSLNGATETIDAFTNSGGTFTTGTGTLIGLGNTITWSGGTNTINDGGTVQDTHWDVSGGTNTVEGGTTGGTLHVQSGGTGFEFTGTGTPSIVLNSDGTNAGRMLLEGNLTVADTITGTATISSGLALANDGFIDMNGGTRTFTVNDATPDIDLEISALVTNGGLTKEGAGTMRLTNDNTYDGTTIINAGTLLVNGDQSTAIGDVNINSGGTLGGTGTIGGATVLNSGGFLSAGDGGIGTLSFQEGGAGSPLNSLDISNASTGSLLFDLGASGNGDLVFVEGQLSIGDGRLDMSHFTFTNLGATSVTGTYTWNLFQIDSTNGSFDFTTLGADTTSTPFASIKSASLAISGDFIQLTMTVPEPSSLAMLGLGGLALALRRKRS